MDYKNIIVEIKDAIAIVTINREKALNALNYELIAELHNFFSKNWIDADFRCVMLTGAGKAFVAGADIAELSELNAATAAKTSEIGHYLMKTIENFPCPVIAAVNGFALGGGCERTHCGTSRPTCRRRHRRRERLLAPSFRSRPCS